MVDLLMRTDDLGNEWKDLTKISRGRGESLRSLPELADRQTDRRVADGPSVVDRCRGVVVSAAAFAGCRLG
jgi:hypothetical protein